MDHVPAFAHALLSMKQVATAAPLRRRRWSGLGDGLNLVRLHWVARHDPAAGWLWCALSASGPENWWCRSTLLWC